MTDAEFLTKFEACELTSDEWTHRDHIRMAYLYLTQNDLETALHNIRIGIKALNQANNVPEGPLMGYNETTTVAFTRLVAATIAAYRDSHPCATADDFCDTHGQLMSPKVLRLFYSPRHRSDPRAKHEFLEPDLAPLPAILADKN